MSSYRCVCKCDQEVAHSENHPPGILTAASPKTKKSIAGFHAACVTKRMFTEGESSCGVVKKQKSLNNLDLAEFIRERGIRSYAEEQRAAGQINIAEFVFKWNEKILCQFVTKTWQIESAKEKPATRKVSQIDTVKTHLTSDCFEGFSGQWLQRAKEVLLLNGIDTFQFVNSIKDLLIHGRGKNRNLRITGPSSCEKRLCWNLSNLFLVIAYLKIMLMTSMLG